MSYLTPAPMLMNLPQLKILKLHQDTLHNISSTSMHDKLYKTVCLLLIRIYKCIFSIAQLSISHNAHTARTPSPQGTAWWATQSVQTCRREYLLAPARYQTTIPQSASPQPSHYTKCATPPALPSN
jgi:hypothetical protein